MHNTPRHHRKRIFLARHGQSISNLQKRISGQLDSPLTVKGHDQAQYLRDVLQHENLSAVFSSTLSRAIDTALPSAECHKLRVKAMDGLKEIHFGVLQGKAIDKTDPAALHLWETRAKAKKSFHIFGAEVFTQFEHRVIECFDTILTLFSGTALIVGHRNTNEVILANLLGLGSASDMNINVKNKYVYEIELSEVATVTTIRLGGERHGQKYPGLKCD